MGKDLGELGSLETTPGGVIPESGTSSPIPREVINTYWGRVLGVISPNTIGDQVAIGRLTAAYNAKLSVEGSIYATGFILSDTVRITKDGSDNLVFTDPVSGSKTLAEILAAAGGDVIVSGTPTGAQLAEWINATTIRGIDKSSLALTQSQITGLVGALAAKAALTHNLIDTIRHPVTGLTTGHFLKALSPTSYGFALHGLTKTDIGLANVTNDAQIKKIASATDLAIARWDGTTGASIKNSAATLDEDGNINIPTGARYKMNGVPISLYGVAAFHTQAFATPTIILDGATYKDFIVDGISDDTEIDLTGVADGESGMIELIIDSTGGYAVTLGTMFTKKLGGEDIVTTADADNIISWRKIGTDILYTVYQIGVVVNPVTILATTPYNVIITDKYIYVDDTVGDIPVNLPPATGSGRVLIIKKVAGANTVIVTADTTGTADDIDGDAAVVLSTLYASLTIQDGAMNKWYIN